MLLTSGHGAGELIAPFLETRKKLEHAVDVFFNTCLVVANECAHLQVFGDGHPREHSPPFGDHHQPFLDQIPGATALDALAQEQDVAILDRQQGGDGLHGGRLARTI